MKITIWIILRAFRQARIQAPHPFPVPTAPLPDVQDQQYINNMICAICAKLMECIPVNILHYNIMSLYAINILSDRKK